MQQHTLIYKVLIDRVSFTHVLFCIDPDSLGEHLISRNNQSKQQLLCPNMNLRRTYYTARWQEDSSMAQIIYK